MPVVNGKKYPYTAKGKAAAKKAAGAGYATNIIKEVKQTAKTVSNAIDKADREMYEKKYGRKLDNKIGRSNVKAQVGQLAGAVLQGRRYDESGKQIKPKAKTASRSVSGTTSKRTSYNLLAPGSRKTTTVTERTTRKPAIKKKSDKSSERMKQVRILDGTVSARSAKPLSQINKARSFSKKAK